MGLKWPKYVLKIKLKMLILDKKANFTQHLQKKGGKYMAKVLMVGHKNVIS